MILPLVNVAEADRECRAFRIVAGEEAVDAIPRSSKIFPVSLFFNNKVFYGS